MATNDYEKLTVDELRAELVVLRREQFNLRMQRATGQPPKPHLFEKARRAVARVNTFITQKLKVGS